MLRAVSGLTGGQVGARLIPGGVYRSGQRIGISINASPIVATAVTANIMYAWPIPVAVNTSLASVAIQVGVAVPGVSGKLGLALPGSDGWPATLIAEAPTPVDMNATAGNELVAAFSANAAVPGAVLWGLCVFNGAAQPVTIGAYSLAAGLVGHYIGQTSIGGYTSQTAPGGAVRLTRAHTYASAFPTTLTGWSATVGTNPSSPVMVGVVA